MRASILLICIVLSIASLRTVAQPPDALTLARVGHINNAHFNRSFAASSVPPYHRQRAGVGNTPRTLKTLGIVMAATGFAVAFTDFVLITPDNDVAGYIGAAVAVSGGPIFTVGSIMQHFSGYGTLPGNRSESYAFANKVSIGIVRGRAGIFIDL